MTIEDPESLTRDGLEDALRAIQAALWFDDDDDESLRPDKSWTPDTLDRVADVMRRHGLGPCE